MSIIKLKSDFKRWCGGSSVLAALLTVNIAVGIAVMLIDFAGRLFGFDTAFLHSVLTLPASPRMLLIRFWTPLTYMWVHFSPLHLLFNMLWLYWFGLMLLDAADQRRLLRLYIGGGLCGALFYILSSLLTPGYAGNLAGSSAAVMSVMTAAALAMPERRVRLFLIGDVKLKWIAAVTILLTLFGGGGGAPAVWAHVGGIAFGAGYHFYAKKFRMRSIFRRAGRARRNMANAGRPASVSNEDASRTQRTAQDDSHARLDELLDKIRISGYASLTPEERRELNSISDKL